MSEEKAGISPGLAIAIGALCLVIGAGVMSAFSGSSDPAPASPPSEEAPAVINLPPGTGAADATLEAARAQGIPDDVASRPPAGLTPEQLEAVNAMTKVMADSKAGRGAAAIESLKGTLRMLMSAQEVAFSMNNTYASELKALHFEADPEIKVRIIEGTQNGWSAEVTRSSVKGSCVTYVGQVRSAPRTAGGRMATTQAYPMCDQ